MLRRPSPEESPAHQTEIDPKSGALLAGNPYNTEFPDRIAFLDVHDPTRTLAGDRRELHGRNGRPGQSLRRSGAPASQARSGLDLDPCRGDPGRHRA